MEFHAGQDGRIRPSDMGAPSAFSGPEAIKFGEQANRPPNLSFGFVEKAHQKAVNKIAGKVHSVSSNNSVSSISAVTAGAKFMERQKMREEREKFLKQMNAAQARDGLSSADTESTTLARFVRNNNSRNDKIQTTDKDLQQAQKLARDAYALLREKRIRDSEKQRNIGGPRR